MTIELKGGPLCEPAAYSLQVLRSPRPPLTPAAAQTQTDQEESQ